MRHAGSGTAPGRSGRGAGDEAALSEAGRPDKAVGCSVPGPFSVTSRTKSNPVDLPSLLTMRGPPQNAAPAPRLEFSSGLWLFPPSPVGAWLYQVPRAKPPGTAD